MFNNQYRQRLSALFTEVARIAADPAGDSPSIRCEIEQLRERLCQLEAEIADSKGCVSEEAAPVAAANSSQVIVETAESPRTSAPLLYDKEWVGYAFSGEEVRPLRDLSESMAGVTVPLLASGQPIGEFKLQPPPGRTWSHEETDLLGIVAQQASVQIQNLRLLQTTERARAEAEAATRSFIHESWDSFLDAIHQSERVGYAYDQASVEPFLAPTQPEGGLQEVVKVMDEHVGTLYLQPDPSRPLTSDDKAMVTSIANQIAQQVENIRLLADASRARAEAEEATRRLTRENWKAYAERREDETLAVAYDTVKVSPLLNEPPAQDIVIEQPLVVRGESIGHLKVAGLDHIEQEAIEITSAIARQASLHLETLRLTEELQKRAFELQELDRIKSSFLANMSHELRTPLNSILGFADVMLEELDGPLTEYMNNDLRLIQKNGQHLLHLINDVLDMAKIEAGRMNLNPEKFHLYEVLDEVTSITSTLASEKNLSLFMDEGSDQQVQIYADRTRLRQVMINLVNNAIKFTEKGKISIKLAPMEGARALIAVQDTGISIPPDKLDAIFQEFTQVDTSTTRKAGGTGLGLPISRRLVEMHGGRLWAESTGIPGEGSTFYVELPLEARITEVVEK